MYNRRRLLILGAAMLIAGVPVAARAANTAPTQEFPFVIPWDDSTTGTANDVSFLNAKPAGVNGRIIVRDGHFVESKTGRRIRFLGVAFDDASAFPSHADADKVAARVAKLGINIVRLSGLDNSGWGPNTNLWEPDLKTFDPDKIDKLDYLIAQFKKNGIYVDVCLHMARDFHADLGLPASVARIPFHFDGRVDEFDPTMLTLEQNYAKELLTHVNPYTGLSLAEDPCVVTVEINNENSLVGDPWSVLGAGLETVPEPFRSELVADWDSWLKSKYGTDDQLRTAWLTGTTHVGPSLVGASNAWFLEQHEGAAATMANEPGSSPDLAAPPAAVTVTQSDGTGWHVQLDQNGLDLKEGDDYTVSFEAKSDTPRTIQIDGSLDQPDWHGIGFNENVALGTDWQKFTYVFTAQGIAPSHNRISLVLGEATGTVAIRNFSIAPGDSGAGLQPGQSLETNTVDIPISATPNQHKDWIAFLADTERGFATSMRTYLRNDLHVQANLTCSQLGYGGDSSIGREADSDYADNHAYWQHPSFPKTPWDPVIWNIGNTSMVADLAAGNGGTLKSLAYYRIAGKPYSISEYDHPAPSDFQAECLPVLASFAAAQNWDAIYLYEYGKYGTGAPNDTIDGYFGIAANPSKSVFLPAAAMIFRAGLITPLPSAAFLPIAKEQLTGGDRMEDVWQREKKADIYSERTAVALPGSSYADATSSIPGDLTVSTAAGGQYFADTNSAVVAAGFLGDQTTRIKGATFKLPPFGNDYAVITLIPRDSKPIAASQRLLLTLVGNVENQGMVWNDAHNSVGDQWGHGPTLAEGIPATISLKTDGPRKVYSLDGAGHRAQSVPAVYANGTLNFSVGPQYKTLWYEIAP